MDTRRDDPIAAPGPGIAVVSGSTYGHTADAAERIAANLRTLTDASVTLRDVATLRRGALDGREALVLGASTWYEGELQPDWDERLDDLVQGDWRGRRVALFGAGDPEGYPDTYGDALGILAERVEAVGASLIGAVAIAPGAVVGDRARRGREAVGLLLDYDNEPEAVAERVRVWCDGLAASLPAGRRAAAEPA